MDPCITFSATLTFTLPRCNDWDESGESIDTLRNKEVRLKFVKSRLAFLVLAKMKSYQQEWSHFACQLYFYATEDKACLY